MKKLLLLMVLASCGGSTSDAEFEAQITQNMHDSLQGDLQTLVAQAQALQAAAPSHAWNHDDSAWAAMNTAWINARHAYEHVEGATAPIFPDVDISIDGRVEDFGPAGTGTLASGSEYMFDTSAMTGLHAVERILYADPSIQYTSDFDGAAARAVVTYENGLGFCPPKSFPTTDQEALDFKNKLAAKLVADAQTLLAGWQPSKIDIGSSYQGLVSLMNEQKEKVTKAGLHEEESRYSQRTMDDLRFNLEGTVKIYALFSPWIKARQGSQDLDAQINAGFDSLNTVYTNYPGLAFPQPPSDWSDLNPSAADLATPFGQLYTAVLAQVNPSASGSVVSNMNAAATLLKLPVFQE